MSRRAIASVVVLAAVIVGAAVLAWRSRDLRLVAVLPATDGLKAGGAVVHSTGMLIGTVERMRIRGRRVIAEFRIDAPGVDVDLRHGDSVRVRRLGMNDKVLEVVPGDASSPRLERGDTVFYSPPPPPARVHQEEHYIGRAAVDRVGPDEISRALSSVSLTSPGVVFPDSHDEHAQYVFNRRSEPSAVEQHNEWDDILIVQAGRGEIRHGGPWRDARNRYQGERRGGSLEAPVTVQVGPGDVVRIPAGEPHRILPVGDTPLSYLVVKVRINRQP